MSFSFWFYRLRITSRKSHNNKILQQIVYFLLSLTLKEHCCCCYVKYFNSRVVGWDYSSFALYIFWVAQLCRHALCIERHDAKFNTQGQRMVINPRLNSRINIRKTSRIFHFSLFSWSRCRLLSPHIIFSLPQFDSMK